MCGQFFTILFLLAFVGLPQFFQNGLSPRDVPLCTAQASVISSNNRRPPPPPPPPPPPGPSGMPIEGSRSSQGRRQAAGNGVHVQVNQDGGHLLHCNPFALQFGVKPICTATVKSIELDYRDDLAPRIESWFDEDGDGYAEDHVSELISSSVTVTSVTVDDPQFHVVFNDPVAVTPSHPAQVQVVFLPRTTAPVNATLTIATSEGPLQCQLLGRGGANPFGLKPLTDISLPVGLPFSPMVAVYNPNDEPLQVKEVFTTHGFLRLQLPSLEEGAADIEESELFTGQNSGTPGIWRIPPHTRRDVIRLVFQSHTEGEYVGFIHMKTDLMDLVVPVEIMVLRGGLSPSVDEIDFGTVIAPVGNLTVGIKPLLEGASGFSEQEWDFRPQVRWWVDDATSQVIDTAACLSSPMPWVDLNDGGTARNDGDWLIESMLEAHGIEKGYWGHRLQAEFLRDRVAIGSQLSELLGEEPESTSGPDSPLLQGCNGSVVAVDSVVLGIGMDFDLGCPWKRSLLNATSSTVPSRWLRLFQRHPNSAPFHIVSVGSRADVSSANSDSSASPFTRKRPLSHGWEFRWRHNVEHSAGDSISLDPPWLQQSSYNAHGAACAPASISQRFDLLSRGSHNITVENAYLSPPTSRIFLLYEPTSHHMSFPDSAMGATPVITISANLAVDSSLPEGPHDLKEEVGKFAFTDDGGPPDKAPIERLEGSVVLRTSDDNPVLSRIELPYTAGVMWGTFLFPQRATHFVASVASEQSHVLRSSSAPAWLHLTDHLETSATTPANEIASLPKAEEALARLAFASGLATVGGIEAPVLSSAMAFGSAASNKSAIWSDTKKGAYAALQSLPVEDWWASGRLQWAPVAPNQALLQASRASEAVIGRRLALNRAAYSTPSKAPEVLAAYPTAAELHPTPVLPMLGDFWLKAAACISRALGNDAYDSMNPRESCGASYLSDWQGLLPLLQSSALYHTGVQQHVELMPRFPSAVSVTGVMSDDPRMTVLNAQQWEGISVDSQNLSLSVGLYSFPRTALPVTRATGARFVFSHSARTLGTEASEVAELAVNTYGVPMWRRGWVNPAYIEAASKVDTKSNVLWGNVMKKFEEERLFLPYGSQIGSQYRDTLFREMQRWRLLGRTLRKEVEFGSSRNKYVELAHLKGRSRQAASAVLSYALRRLTTDAIALLHKVLPVLPQDYDSFQELQFHNAWNATFDNRNPWGFLQAKGDFGAVFLAQLEEWEVAVVDSMYCETPGQCDYTPPSSPGTKRSPGSSLFTGWMERATEYSIQGYDMVLGRGPRSKLEALWSRGFHGDTGYDISEWSGQQHVPTLPEVYRYWLGNVWRGCSVRDADTLASEHVDIGEELLRFHGGATSASSKNSTYSGTSWAWLLGRIQHGITPDHLASVLEDEFSDSSSYAAAARAAGAEAFRVASEADIGAAMAVERLACFANSLLDGAGIARGSWVSSGARIDLDTTPNRPKEEPVPLASAASIATLLNGSWVNSASYYTTRTATGQGVLTVPRELLTAALPPLLKCPKSAESFRTLLERSAPCPSCSALLPTVLDPMGFALLPWHAVVGAMGSQGSLAWLRAWPLIGTALLGHEDEAGGLGSDPNSNTPTSMAFSGCDLTHDGYWWSSGEDTAGLYSKWMPRLGLSLSSKNSSLAAFAPDKGFLSTPEATQALLRCVDSSIEQSHALSPAPLPFTARVVIATNASAVHVPLTVHSGVLSAASRPTEAHSSSAWSGRAARRFWEAHRPSPRSPLLAAMVRASMSIERKHLGTLRSSKAVLPPQDTSRRRDSGAFWGGRMQRGAAVGAAFASAMRKPRGFRSKFLSSFAATRSPVFTLLWNEGVDASGHALQEEQLLATYTNEASNATFGLPWPSLPRLKPTGAIFDDSRPHELRHSRNTTSNAKPCVYGAVSRGIFGLRGAQCVHVSGAEEASAYSLGTALHRVDASLPFVHTESAQGSVPAGNCRVLKSSSARRASCVGPSLADSTRSPRVGAVFLHRAIHASVYGLPMLFKKPPQGFLRDIPSQAVLQRRDNTISYGNHSGRALPQVEAALLHHDIGLAMCAAVAPNFEPMLHLPTAYHLRRKGQFHVPEGTSPFSTLGSLVGQHTRFSSPVEGHTSSLHHAAALTPDQRSLHPYAHAGHSDAGVAAIDFGPMLAGYPLPVPAGDGAWDVGVAALADAAGGPQEVSRVLPLCNRNGIGVRVLSLSVRCDLLDVLDVEVVGWTGAAAVLHSREGLEASHSVLKQCRRTGKCVSTALDQRNMKPSPGSEANESWANQSLPTDLDFLHYTSVCEDCGGTYAHLNSSEEQHWLGNTRGWRQKLLPDIVVKKSVVYGVYGAGRLSSPLLEGYLASPMLEDGRRPPTHAMAGGEPTFKGEGKLGGGLSSAFSRSSQKSMLKSARHASPRAASNASVVFAITLPPGECMDLQVSLRPEAMFRRLHATHHGNAALEEVGFVRVSESTRGAPPVLHVQPQAVYAFDIPDAVSLITDLSSVHVGVSGNVSLGQPRVHSGLAWNLQAAIAGQRAAVATTDPATSMSPQSAIFNAGGVNTSQLAGKQWRSASYDPLVIEQALAAFRTLGSLLFTNSTDISEVMLGKMYWGETVGPSLQQVLAGVLDVVLPGYTVITPNGEVDMAEAHELHKDANGATQESSYSAASEAGIPPVWLLSTTGSAETSEDLVIENTSPVPLHVVGAATSDSRFTVSFTSEPGETVIPPFSRTVIGRLTFNPLRLPRHLVSGTGTMTQPHVETGHAWETLGADAAADVCSLMLWLDQVSEAQGDVTPVSWSSKWYDVEVKSECWDGYLAWLGDSANSVVQLLLAEAPPITGIAAARLTKRSVVPRTSSYLSSGFRSSPSGGEVQREEQTHALSGFAEELSRFVMGTPAAALLPAQTPAQLVKRCLRPGALADAVAEVSNNLRVLEAGVFGGYSPLSLSAVPGTVGNGPYAPASVRTRPGWSTAGLSRYSSPAQAWQGTTTSLMLENALDRQAMTATLKASLPTLPSGTTARVMVAVHNPSALPLQVQLSPAMPSTLERLCASGEEFGRIITNLVMLRVPQRVYEESLCGSSTCASASGSPLYIATRLGDQGHLQSLGLESWFDRFRQHFENVSVAQWSDMPRVDMDSLENATSNVWASRRTCRWEASPQAALSGATPWQDSVFAGPWSACACCAAGVDELIGLAMDATAAPAAPDSQGSGDAPRNSIIHDPEGGAEEREGSGLQDEPSGGAGLSGTPAPFHVSFLDGFLSGLRNDSLRGEAHADAASRGAVNPNTIWRCAMGLTDASVPVSQETRKSSLGRGHGPLTCGELLGLAFRKGSEGAQAAAAQGSHAAPGAFPTLHPAARSECRVCKRMLSGFQHLHNPRLNLEGASDAEGRLFPLQGGPVVTIPPRVTSFLGPITFRGDEQGVHAVWLQLSNNDTGNELVPLAFNVIDSQLRGSYTKSGAASQRVVEELLQAPELEPYSRERAFFNASVNRKLEHSVPAAATNPTYAREELLSRFSYRDVHGNLLLPFDTALQFPTDAANTLGVPFGFTEVHEVTPGSMGGAPAVFFKYAACPLQLSRWKVAQDTAKVAPLDPVKSPTPSAPTVRARRGYTSLYGLGTFRGYSVYAMARIADALLSVASAAVSWMTWFSSAEDAPAPIVRVLHFTNPNKLPLTVSAVSLGSGGCMYKGMRLIAVGVVSEDGRLMVANASHASTTPSLCDLGWLPRLDQRPQVSPEGDSNASHANAVHSFLHSVFEVTHFGIQGSLADELRRLVNTAAIVQSAEYSQEPSGVSLAGNEKLALAVIVPGAWVATAPSAVPVSIRADDYVYHTTVNLHHDEAEEASDMRCGTPRHASSFSVKRKDATVGTVPLGWFVLLAPVLAAAGVMLTVLGGLNHCLFTTVDTLMAPADEEPDKSVAEGPVPSPGTPVSKQPQPGHEPLLAASPPLVFTMDSAVSDTAPDFVIPHNSPRPAVVPAARRTGTPKTPASTPGKPAAAAAKAVRPTHDPLPPSPDEEEKHSPGTGFEEMVAKIEEELARIEPVAQELRDSTLGATLKEEAANRSEQAAKSPVLASGGAAPASPDATEEGKSDEEAQVKQAVAEAAPPRMRSKPADQASAPAPMAGAPSDPAPPLHMPPDTHQEPAAAGRVQEAAGTESMPKEDPAKRNAALGAGRQEPKSTRDTDSRVPTAKIHAQDSDHHKKSDALEPKSGKKNKEKKKKKEEASLKNQEKTKGMQAALDAITPLAPGPSKTAAETPAQEGKPKAVVSDKKGNADTRVKKDRKGKEVGKEKEDKKPREDRESKKSKKEKKEKETGKNEKKQEEKKEKGKKEKKEKKEPHSTEPEGLQDMTDTSSMKDQKASKGTKSKSMKDQKAAKEVEAPQDTKHPQNKKGTKEKKEKKEKKDKKGKKGKKEAKRDKEEAPKAAQVQATPPASVTAGETVADSASSGPMTSDPGLSTDILQPGAPSLPAVSTSASSWNARHDAAHAGFSSIDLGGNVHLLPVGITTEGRLRFALHRFGDTAPRGEAIDLELAQGLALIKAHSSYRGVSLAPHSFEYIQRSLPILQAAQPYGMGSTPSFTSDSSSRSMGYTRGGSDAYRESRAAYDPSPYPSLNREPSYSSQHFPSSSHRSVIGSSSDDLPPYGLLSSGTFPHTSTPLTLPQPNLDYLNSPDLPLGSHTYPSSDLRFPDSASVPPDATIQSHVRLQPPVSADDDEDAIGDLLSLLGKGDSDLNLSPTPTSGLEFAPTVHDIKASWDRMGSSTHVSGAGGGGGGSMHSHAPLSAGFSPDAPGPAPSQASRASDSSGITELDMSGLGLSLGLGVKFPSPTQNGDQAK